MSRFRLGQCARALLLLVALAVTAACDGFVSPPRPPSSSDAGFGAWVGTSTVEAVEEYEAWVGRDVTHVHSFLPQSSWTAMLASADWAFGAWNGTDYEPVFSIPMLVKDGSTLSAGSAGASDAHYRSLAEKLVANGRGDAIIRLGWELNGDWFPWSANDAPSVFASYWRRIVTTMRAVPGASGLRFDWCVAYGGDVPDDAYPGDQYVDFIGMDVYDQSFTLRQSNPVERWNDLMHRAEGGLLWQRDFAAAHGKPMSYPEWAVSSGPHFGGASGDNPYFIEQMANWIASNDVAYALYFESDPAGGYKHALEPGTFPLSAAAYRAANGG